MLSSSLSLAKFSLFPAHIEYIHGFACKLRSACTTNIVNIFRKFSSTGIHSSKTA